MMELLTLMELLASHAIFLTIGIGPVFSVKNVQLDPSIILLVKLVMYVLPRQLL
jgi:hypothetical protein